MPLELAVIEFLFLLLALPLSYGMARWMIYVSKPDFRDDIQSQFLCEWNGQPDDEYYAWMRLRNRYRYLDSLPKHLIYIQQQMNSCHKRDMLSGYSVGEMGEIVKNISDPNNSKKIAE